MGAKERAGGDSLVSAEITLIRLANVENIEDLYRVPRTKTGFGLVHGSLSRSRNTHNSHVLDLEILKCTWLDGAGLHSGSLNRAEGSVQCGWHAVRMWRTEAGIHHRSR